VDASPPLHADLSARFDTTIETVDLHGETFSLLAVRDTNRLVDALTPEAFAIDERMPYWAELWTASIALARECLTGPSLAGRTVLELGCGLGLAGIAAARAGADVLLTDYDEDAVAFARHNAERNLPPDSRDRVAVRMLDWRSPDGIDPVGVILGADITYERRSFRPLLMLFHRLLRPGGVVILADPERAIGFDFLRAAEGEGFTVTTEHRREARRGRMSGVTIARLTFWPADDAEETRGSGR
jgi:predicted nicotinamide N-methyase